jgi:transcriptional regulator with XRE-family HTH domain
MPRRKTAKPTESLTGELRTILQEDGRTGNELAILAGISRGQIYRFLSGERGLHSESIDRLWQVLGLRILKPRKRQ